MTELVNLHLMAEFRELPRIFTMMYVSVWAMVSGLAISISLASISLVQVTECSSCINVASSSTENNQLFNKLVSRRATNYDPVMFLDIVRGAMTLQSEMGQAISLCNAPHAS